MRALTQNDFVHWCAEKGLDLLNRERPYYGDAHRHSFVVKLPDRPSRLLALARCCFPSSDYEAHFQGAMIWFRDWGIWNEVDEEMGARVIRQMRAGLGETRELMEAPGHIFSQEEFVDARAFWTWPVFLGWDAILFPQKSDYFVFNSHDEVVCFVAREKQLYTELLESLKKWGPEENEWYFRSAKLT